MQDRIVAEAVRIEYEEKSGKMYIVFEVKDEKYKQDLRKTWTKDIEFRLVDRFLVKESDE
jgi:hypothetical protein